MHHLTFRQQRQALNLSQMDVARISKVHRTTISQFEKHGITLTTEQMVSLESALKYHRVNMPIPIAANARAEQQGSRSTADSDAPAGQGGRQ